MVQTYQSPVRIYKHPFELVMAAYQRRFPTCPQIPIFVGSEILSEYHSPDGAEEVVERKCQLNVEAPYLVKKIAGVDFVYFNQKNSLDRRKRTLLIEASNITFSSRVIVKENCNYYVHPDHDWTCFEQSASLDVKSFFGFETSVEKLAGKEILEFFIEDLIKSGTTYIPRFVEPEVTPTEDDAVVPNSPADSAIDVSKGETKMTQNASSPVETVEKKVSRRQSTTSGVMKPTISSGSGIANGNAVRSSSFDDTEAKLETEYIHRFLGQLSPLEESRLCELKYGLQSAHKGKLPNDAHLLRFLRARDFDVQKARDMIINSLLWRKQHNVDKILQVFVPPSVLLQYFPGCWHHCDLEGRPLFVLRLGQMDVKGILRAVGLEAVVKFILTICEEGLLKAAEATVRLGKPIGTWTLLVDLEGLSLRHLWRPGVQSLLRIIETLEAHYPETMGLVLIARAPRVFPVLWTLVSPFIDENTRKKFMINSNETVLNELSKYIDKKYLPNFLGGPCEFDCIGKSGGHVPKSEYRPVQEQALRENEEDILTSTYTSASIHRGAPHEVCVNVPSAGCVLTWDFDVIKGECEFVLYHSGKVIKQNAQPTSPNPVERVTAVIASTSLLSSSSPPFVVAVDPNLKLGPEISIQEKPVIFGEGDSMQGSHFCTSSGTYIMQWRSPEASTGHHQSFDFSNLSHKCKLMYYFELLNSADFRGSVASLQSCRSSFGSLAAAVDSGINPPENPSSSKNECSWYVGASHHTHCAHKCGEGAGASQDQPEHEDTHTQAVPQLRPSSASHTPVEVSCFLLVDHIEELNELQQTLTFHGTMLLSWEDRRLVWEPKDYGSLNKLSFSLFDYSNFWTPSVTVKGISMSRSQLMQFHNTEYTLTSNGRIFAEIGVSIKASCRIDLHNYPYDNQTCFVMIFTPLYSTSKVTFSPSPSFLSRESLFASNNMTSTAGFRLTDLTAQRFYAYAKGFTLNESEAQANPMFTNTVVRFQLLLRRNTGLYVANVSLPLFCCAIMTFMAALSQNIRLSIIWLAACLALQILANNRIMTFLPRDYDSEPFCTRFSKFLILQTFALMIYRFVIAFQLDNDDNKRINQSTIVQIEKAVKYGLVAEAIIIFWLLFC
uniref:CRAL-TRIO domain-containing protein n=1 Tax=Ditylenchus dipsaci TaxID=166011 RepID=A0A915D8G2_9BILA